jgi:hypothetical protein
MKALSDFGSAISSALSHCYRCASRAWNCEKLPEEVKAIALCFRCPKLWEKQEKMRADDNLQALGEDTGSAEKLPSSSEGPSVGTSSQSGLRRETPTAEAWSPDPNNTDDILKMYGMAPSTKGPRSLGRQPSCISVKSVQSVQSSRASSAEAEELYQSTCFGLLFSRLPRFVFCISPSLEIDSIHFQDSGLHRWRRFAVGAESKIQNKLFDIRSLCHFVMRCQQRGRIAPPSNR